MAPQRDSGDDRSSRLSCSFNSESIVLLTFAVIFFVSCLGLGYLYPLRRKRALLRGHARDGALWTVLWVSLALESITHILDIANIVVGRCAQNSPFTILYLGIAAGSLEYITGFLIVSVMLLPITRLMHECAGGIVSRATSITHKVFVGLMGADVIVVIALLIWYITDLVDAYDTYTQFAGGVYGGFAGLFGIVYNGLGIIVSIIGMLSFTSAIRKAPQLRRSGKLRALAYLLTVALLAKYVTRFALLWVDSGIEGYILDHTFLLVAITTALYFVPSAALASANNPEPPRYEPGTAPPGYNTRYTPVNTLPQEEVYFSQGNVDMAETYDVPPIPRVRKPQELTGGYTAVHQPPTHPQQLPSSPGPYSPPVELPHQPYRPS